MAVNTTFDIEINYTGDPRYLGAFQAAADRWEQIITADVPDVNSGQFGFIDDLRIDASVISIDGAGASSDRPVRTGFAAAVLIFRSTA